jgi:asparagine synthase (glutamine-hydrolysing)
MCGVAGIFGYSHDAPAVDTDELLRIREQMVRRGPDGAGLWISSNRRVGLAHRRLAIIDLTPDAAQPMASADGRYQIVFNGEIYNYRELRDELRRQGVLFRSLSDTEVLLQLYAREGAAMCRRLRGMYAFAIWDTQQQSLFLARDPFGIKPLYFNDDGRSFRFASQVKALLAGGAIARDADPIGESGYWIWGSVPEPHTLYAGIKAFAPGTSLKLCRDGRRERQEFDSVAGMLEDAREDQPPATSLRESMLDTIRHHLIADVPVGVFLSAGIDSATLAALASRCEATLNTLTLGFEEYRGTPADETLLAETVARRYGTRHQTIWIRQSDFEGALDSFLEDMDQPSIDGLNTWLVARATAHAGLKVAISGLGGDEFFGGYPSFRQVPLLRRYARPFCGVPGLGKMLRRLSAPVLGKLTSQKYAGLLEYGASWEGAYLLRRAVRMPWELGSESKTSEFERPTTVVDDALRAEGSPQAIVSWLEATLYMRNQLLRDSDWAGMAHSVEIRVPLVDRELLRYVASQRRAGRVLTKQDLSATASPALPKELINRAKTGFTVPVRDWMRRTGSLTGTQRGLRDWQAQVAEAFF